MSCSCLDSDSRLCFKFLRPTFFMKLSERQLVFLHGITQYHCHIQKGDEYLLIAEFPSLSSLHVFFFFFFKLYFNDQCTASSIDLVGTDSNMFWKFLLFTNHTNHIVMQLHYNRKCIWHVTVAIRLPFPLLWFVLAIRH